MYKKNIPVILLFFSAFLFSSCWIYPDYKDYEIKDGVYYFEDYETMKSVIIPMINKSFSAWHWSSKEFDKKYDKYFGNVEANSDDVLLFSDSSYKYSVRTSSTKAAAKPMERDNDGKLSEKTISGEYYWITSSDGAVIFYQN